jgi:excinuclease ABC subunit A
MPDVYVECEVCNGRRYNQETLAVKFHGHSIADILDLTIEDALPVLADVPLVRQKLQTLVDVGLGYVHLGQSATTLSGGEAQRMKLARELSKRQTGRTLYLLDEPTTGLHFDDVRKLLEVLHRLADLGNSVIIIEHNLDVIRNADWILDLGPEGGEDGGRVVGEGRPAKIAATPGSYTGQFLTRYYASSNGKLAAIDENEETRSRRFSILKRQTRPALAKGWKTTNPSPQKQSAPDVTLLPKQTLHPRAQKPAAPLQPRLPLITPARARRKRAEHEHRI